MVRPRESGNDVESPRLMAAIDQALSTGRRDHLVALVELLDRSSGLPGPRPNLDLARPVGAAIASRPGRKVDLIRALVGTDEEFPIIVAAHALAARFLAGTDAADALADLVLLAGDSRATVRTGIIHALRHILRARPAVLAELRGFTDGYLQAHVLLDALADRELLSSLAHDADLTELLARLDEIFALADAAPRAAERSQGVRTLRQHMPAQLAVVASRIDPAMPWIIAKIDAASRPETREMLGELCTALRKASFRGADVARLEAALAGRAPLPRDPSRIVAGTRRRGGKGKR